MIGEENFVPLSGRAGYHRAERGLPRNHETKQNSSNLTRDIDLYSCHREIRDDQTRSDIFL